MAVRWTLQNELDWFVEQANNPRLSLAERGVWQQLADELSARLGINPTSDDTTLF